MDPLDTSAAPVHRFDIHAGATHARNAWLLLPKLPFLVSDRPKILRSSESKAPHVPARVFWLLLLPLN